MSACRLRVIALEFIRAACVRCKDRAVERTEAGEFECICLRQVEQDPLRALAVIALNGRAVELAAACRDRQIHIAACDIDDHDAVIGNDEVDGGSCPWSELREREQLCPFGGGKIPDVCIGIALTREGDFCFILCFFRCTAGFLCGNICADLAQRIKCAAHINQVGAVDGRRRLNVDVFIGNIGADCCAAFQHTVADRTVIYKQNQRIFVAIAPMCADAVCTDAVHYGKLLTDCKFAFAVCTFCVEILLQKQRKDRCIGKQGFLIGFRKQSRTLRFACAHADFVVICKTRNSGSGYTCYCEYCCRCGYDSALIPFSHVNPPKKLT